MTLDLRGHAYPPQSFRVLAFPMDLGDLFLQPAGFVGYDWPLTQVAYVGQYLRDLGCKTVLVEEYYIDRDFISDASLFYARSLRSYPNYCYRLHFFAENLTQRRWKTLVTQPVPEKRAKSEQLLQNAYLGFMVVRPLPGAPVGRTVLRPLAEQSSSGHRRVFAAAREYVVHAAGFTFRVDGLAFQQQDQGVSACATTALWSSLHKVAHLEGLAIPTPAEITEAASRYVLAGGRSLPSEGLNAYQMCEATRAAGLSPQLVAPVGPEDDRNQLFSYIKSGFAPVLTLVKIRENGEPGDLANGHAVTGLGLKLGEITPQSDPNLHYRDAASAVLGLYVHDDRLGPYALADIVPHTWEGRVWTALDIRMPGEQVEYERSLILGILVPVPTKLRLTVTRMRELGMPLAEAMGACSMPGASPVTLSCHYAKGVGYREAATNFALSKDALYRLLCEVVLSRYVGVIELSAAGKPLFDVVVDATETCANPSILCCVRRQSLDPSHEPIVAALAQLLGCPWLY